ncbi:hypothetical protein [Streptomyces sp. NPDC093225]|uniref:hypothetical protein n=1 Tax=Streptomyces sp. NPDC093225 TaxID=3366034 RepID=UPI003827111D
MTLLVLAESSDETAVRFARSASERGVEAVVAADFDRLAVSVTVSRELHSRSTVLVDGRPPTGILCRGRPDASTPPTPAARFAASERQAAVWSAVALWPGPVVNRPTVHGYPPRLDPLELASSVPGIRPAGTLTDGRDATGANHAYRISDHAQLDPAARTPYDVVHLTRLDAGRTHRLLVAGTSTFHLGDPARRADLARHAPQVTRIRNWLHAKQTDFAIVTLETADADDGALRLLEASPWPNHHQFASVADAAYAALLTRLTRLTRQTRPPRHPRPVG